mmetsp:Transcript_28376/g.67528  ORF Transcript_28376/g.67528 Transcript_28376/m.67528 type:complete len:203 (+) Transcript_28376:413-1021(+)
MSSIEMPPTWKWAAAYTRANPSSGTGAFPHPQVSHISATVKWLTSVWTHSGDVGLHAGMSYSLLRSSVIQRRRNRFLVPAPASSNQNLILKKNSSSPGASGWSSSRSVMRWEQHRSPPLYVARLQEGFLCAAISFLQLNAISGGFPSMVLFSRSKRRRVVHGHSISPEYLAPGAALDSLGRRRLPTPPRPPPPLVLMRWMKG